MRKQSAATFRKDAPASFGATASTPCLVRRPPREDLWEARGQEAASGSR